jgi:MFS family permease
MHCSSVSYGSSKFPPHPRSSKLVASGAIAGQVFVGLLCDRFGRKVALLSTTAFIVVGATLGAAAQDAHGNARRLFWFLTVARGIAGVVSVDIRLRMCVSDR